MTRPLSPTAQAVLDAVASKMEGGWISPDFVPYESEKLAAALRALADQAGSAKHWLVYQIRAIAAELDGHI